MSAGLVEAYDRKVLEACGLSEKAQMRFQEFVENVQKNVIESGKLGGNLWELSVE